MIGRHAVAAQQGEVFDIGGGFRLLAVDRVVEADVGARVARHAEAQRERLARGGAAVALLAGSSRMPALKSQVPCAPDFSLSPVWAGVKSR